MHVAGHHAIALRTCFTDVTFAIYVHGIPTEERRAVENVEKLVFEPKRTQVSEGSQSGEVLSR